MTRRVWKYVLEYHTPNTFDMPEGAEIVHVHEQNDLPTMWALVDDTKPMVRRVFFVRGTGFDVIRDDSKYIGTVHNPPYVWHIFEMLEPEKPYIQQ